MIRQAVGGGLVKAVRNSTNCYSALAYCASVGAVIVILS